MLVQVHAAIRADPSAEKKERKKPSEPKKWKEAKLTYDERKEKLKVLSTSGLVAIILLAMHLIGLM